MLSFPNFIPSTPYNNLIFCILLTLLNLLHPHFFSNCTSSYSISLLTYTRITSTPTTIPTPVLPYADPPLIPPSISIFVNVERKTSHTSDENNAQIFRLKLDEPHLSSRIHFSRYRNLFNYFALAVPSFVLSRFVDESMKDGALLNGDLIPVVLGILAVLEGSGSLVRVSFEESASRTSEKQLSVIVGGVGVCFGDRNLL